MRPHSDSHESPVFPVWRLLWNSRKQPVCLDVEGSVPEEAQDATWFAPAEVITWGLRHPLRGPDAVPVSPLGEVLGKRRGTDTVKGRLFCRLPRNQPYSDFWISWHSRELLAMQLAWVPTCLVHRNVLKSQCVK